MANGIYGNVRGAEFDPLTDAEIWSSYRSNRSDTGSEYELVENIGEYLTYNGISGLYQLKLPYNKFNKVGIYNLYIKPRTIKTTIQDVGVLATYPDIRGVIIDSSNGDLGNLNITNDSLVGYTIEYFSRNGEKILNNFTIITSINPCENTQKLTGGSPSYRFTNDSNLLFATVTPSAASNARPLIKPLIGMPGQEITISNTFFNPELVEIEITDNDIDSLYQTINGNQVRNIENNRITTYDDDNNIINQIEYYEIKESPTANPMYEVRKKTNNIVQNADEIDILNKLK